MTESMSIEPLKKALASLEAALQAEKTDLARDASIQRFEYTFELSWKILKRYLETELGEANADTSSKKELFRIASENGLILDAEIWFGYNNARNKTSHTYNEITADEVYDSARSFSLDCRRLLLELEGRLS